MTPQEKAETVLIIIRKLIKWAFWVGIGLILIFGLIVGYQVANDWFTNTRHKNKIQVQASFDSEECGKLFGLKVEIKNKSSKTLEHLEVYFKVTKKGYSTQLNSWDSFTSDKILKPNEEVILCSMVEAKDSNGFDRKYLKSNDLVAEITRTYATFKD